METQHQSEEKEVLTPGPTTEDAPYPGQAQKTQATGCRRAFVIALDRFILKLARNWLTWLTAVAVLYTGTPFLAPVFLEFDMPGPANVIYGIYDKLCHQLAFRSWFLFGEQAYYPRERAHLPVRSFEEYAADDPTFDGLDVYTLDYNLIVAAGRFVGNDVMGWKVAYCQRDIAIYGSIGLFCVVFGLLRRMGVKVPPLPFWAYIFLGLVPVGLDGVTQLLANPPYNGFGLAWFPLYESTPFLRTLTGALFGICSAWLAIPYLEESMNELVVEITRKFERAGIEI